MTLALTSGGGMPGNNTAKIHMLPFSNISMPGNSQAEREQSGTSLLET